MTEDELWVHYHDCLQCMDWTYHFSDDHGVWQAGSEKEKHLIGLRKIVKRFDEEIADLLWNTYNPWLNGYIDVNQYY